MNLPPLKIHTPFTILFDQREKQPYDFANAEKTFLSMGDYSVKGYHDKIAIERKSLNDLASSMVGRNRKLFEKNVKRAMDELDYYAIVVEANYEDTDSERNWYCKLTAESLKGSILCWSVKYGVPVFFCSDRNHARDVVRRLLKGFLYYHKKPIKVISNE